MADVVTWLTSLGLSKAAVATQQAGIDSSTGLARLQSDAEDWANFCECAGLTLREAKKLETALLDVDFHEFQLWLVSCGLPKAVEAAQRAGIESATAFIRLQLDRGGWLNFCEGAGLSIREVKTLERALAEWSATPALLTKAVVRLETERTELSAERDDLRWQVARSAKAHAEVTAQLQAERETSASAKAELAKLLHVVEKAADCLAVGQAPPPRERNLSSLDELLPTRPDGKDWRTSEVPAMLEEFFPGDVESQRKYSIDAFAWQHRVFMASVAKETGISVDDATLLALLTTAPFAMPMARALRAGDPCYAMATYTLSRVAARAAQQRGPGAVAPRLYAPLYGSAGLVLRDPAWASLEDASTAGTSEVVSIVAVKASCDASDFQEAGFILRLSGKEHLQDSPLVCFESEASDCDAQGGLHGAAMTGIDSGIFPPNTLFRLKEVKDAPFEAEVVTSHVEAGVRLKTIEVQQRCFVVSATFQKLR